MRRCLALLLLAVFTGCTPKQSVNRLVAPFVSRVGDTDSMVPTIVPHQLIYVSAANFSDIKPNDIIVYWEEARQLNICHRVLAIRHSFGGDALICRGDNNPSNDWHVVTPDMLIGKVTKIYPTP